MKYKQVYYDVIGAYEYGVRKHPQTDMIDRGFELIQSVPQSICDAWFFTVEDIIEPLPPYIKLFQYDFDYWQGEKK